MQYLYPYALLAKSLVNTFCPLPLAGVLSWCRLLPFHILQTFADNIIFVEILSWPFWNICIFAEMRTWLVWFWQNNFIAPSLWLCANIKPCVECVVCNDSKSLVVMDYYPLWMQVSIGFSDLLLRVINCSATNVRGIGLMLCVTDNVILSLNLWKCSHAGSGYIYKLQLLDLCVLIGLYVFWLLGIIENKFLILRSVLYAIGISSEWYR